METSKYQQLFISESEDYIQTISSNILILEKNPSDSDAIKNIFRGLHTLKGMAASMGYSDIAQLSHMMEDIIDMIRSGQLELYRELIDVLLKGNDYINSLVHNEDIDKDIIGSFKSVLTSIKKGKSAVEKKSSPENTVELKKGQSALDVYFEDDVMLKSARAYLVIKSLQDRGVFIRTVPEYEEIMEDDFGDKFTVVLKGESIDRDIIKSLEAIPEISRVSEFENESQDTPKPVLPETRQFAPETAEIKNDIKVSLDRLDTLQNYASELVIARGRLQQLAYSIHNPELINALSNTSKIITNIQDEVMKIRMVPVWQVFDRYPRYIRDLARELGKEVDFRIKGRDIELDRSLLNALADPLLHLLKNSIDHGIEKPEVRKKNGKPQQGRLLLEARRLKNAIIITVSDDGRGLNQETILAKAIDKGIVNEEQAEKLTPQEIFNFITYSGFSTKDETTDISGRGVGVDAVKNVLKRIGGSFEIDSREDKGTVFSMKVPLTLAIIKSLIVRVEDERYIVPLTHVTETIDIVAGRIQSIMGREVFVLRETVIPIIRLSETFNIEIDEDKDKNENEDKKISLVIVHMDDSEFAMLIEEFVEQTEIVVKPLKGLLSGIKGLAGVTILNDGIPAFIIDVPSIFELAKAR
ncbi:MAG: chemotaxis protein CheA [bacterium]